MAIDPNTQLVVVNSLEDCFTLKRWLGERKDVIGIDTETTGLTWQKPGDGLRLVQIGDKMNGFVVPWDQWGGVFMEALNSWDGRIALHNANFDLKFLTKFADWEIPWDRIDDTMIMARIVFPGQPATLKGMSEKYIDPRADIGQVQLKEAMKKNGWGWDTVPIDFPAYTNYSALDPVLTAHLWEFLTTHHNFHQETYDLEMGYLRMAYKMEKKGMRIDVQYCEEQVSVLDDYVIRAKEYGQEEFGLSIGSSKQLVEYFVEHDATFTHRTPSGAPSANAEQLEEFRNDSNPDISDLATLVLEARKSEKLKSTYFQNFVNDNVDGILYPSINTMGAITGRSSVRNPALQTLPSGSNIVRNAFIPRNEGELIVTADLDQVEARIFSIFSEDEGFQSAFKTADATGSDFFTEIGRMVYNDASMGKEDPRRKIMKTYIYASLFGSSLARQAKTAGVSLDYMKDVSNKVAERFPNMKKFQQDMINTVEDRARNEGEGYILTKSTGNRIPIESDKAYKAVNYIIQSYAAWYLKRAIINMDSMGIGDYILLPVHDEVLVSCPASETEEVGRIMSDCMTDTSLAVPLTAGADKPIYRWGDAY